MSGIILRVMKYKNFENQISEAFRQDSAAVDTDALLASLGIPVTVEKERRTAYWVYSALALLLLLLVGSYFFINRNTNTGQVFNEVSNTNLSQNNLNHSPNESGVIASSDFAEEERSDESSEKLLTEQNVDSTEGLVEDVVRNLEKTEISNNSTNYSQNQTRKLLSDRDQIIANVKQKVSDVSSQTTAKNSVISEFNSHSEVSAMEARNVESEKIKGSDSKSILTENRSSIDDVFLLDLLDVELVSQKEYPGLMDPECPSFSYRIPWNISLLAEVGVMKPMKELESDNPELDSIFAFREMNENSKEAIQLGLHAKVSRGSNPLYVRGGIAYTRIAEQMTEEYDYTEQDTMRGVISITESMDGDTITRIYGDIISETRYTGRTVKHYFLHLWDFPIAVGYEIPVGGSFYVGGELGVQFNFRTSGTGFVFRDVNDYADLSEVSTKETKVGMSYFGGFHFGKHLNKRSSIQLSARFRYYPNRFSTVDPSITQRYNLAGLHAGYVYRF